jgi:valyl-tRNA synthetase
MSTVSPPQELPKQYHHAEPEKRWYQFWLERRYFHSVPEFGPGARKPYTIVIPPPNVTGALHLGHALNNTLQDILIRTRRMQGYNALWMPGTDHAGIATQAVVEKRLLTEEKKSRHDLGREKLVERIWEWKQEYEQRILSQLKRLGSSCDWERTRFTLDEICARAVRHTFFSLFKEGLIFRGKRLVNWDTYLQTAVSDDEVFHETVAGNFWHLKYEVIAPQPGEPTHVTIATTRPETMLGDTAVAVHPDPATALDKAEAELREKLAAAPEKQKAEVQAELDAVIERRQTMLPALLQLRDMALAGRKVMLPLLNREIPLVADVWAKPELGSGCVKITPAHDPNDYDVAKRQSLPMINIMNPDGTLNANAGPYQGLSMAKAREKVVADLDALGLLAGVEDRQIELAHSDRSKTPIEPYLADQWFVKMDQLAQSAMDAVTDGRVKIFPPRYARGYLDWLGEKRDWPVSRQLWWGHRIPIWYAPDATEAELKKAFAGRKDVVWHRDEEHNQWLISAQEDDLPESAIPGKRITQDPDVLDTWFSSALWPHSTLGWPEQTPELKYYYPTSTLVTSRDIITLWVARMVLTGLHNVGDVPFREVFVHPKILDGFGDTMSKSKGNGVDPLDVIDKFGADALRFGLADLTTETQDVRMPVEFECPHCGALIEQTKKNRVLPRVPCKECGKEFSTQWATKPEDTALPRGAVVSERFEKGRNFCNKLWNASRFALLNLEGYTPAPVPDDQLTVEDRWILSRMATVTDEVTAAIDGYRYADATGILYEFAWNEFCSFYVEMVKSRLQDVASRPVAQRVLAHVLDSLVRLLHPVIPFITEEIWQLLGSAAPERGLESPEAPAESVMIATWPVADHRRQDREIEARFARFQEALKALREVRSRQNIQPKTTINFSVRCDAATADLLKPMAGYFESLAGAKSTAWGPDVTPPATNASAALTGGTIFVDLAGLIDVGAEIAKKEKERANCENMIRGKESKLANASFVERAPADVVAKERESLAELKERLTAIEATLAELKKQK